MIEKNVFLTSFLIVFWLFVFLYRCWDVLIKRYGRGGKIHYRWTLAILSIIHFLVGFFSLLEYSFLVHSYNWVIGFAAFFAFLVGQIIRNWAVKSLGILHSPQIEIKENHKIIQSPPYCYLRHPYYLGVILEVGSSPLIFNAYFAFLFYLLAYLPILLVRVFLEEKVMRCYFGLLYDEYRTRTPQFIPRFRKRIET